jgi:alpha-N-arabinofuranosidase
MLLAAARCGGAEPASPSTSNAAIEVTIDATAAGPPINPFIYGQFIEHLGRCIYGGIWAEMLEDRKFYFPVTDAYHPYGELTNTKFPVVSASPWEIVGPAGSVTMMKDGAFVGEHSPQVAAGSGIRQNDLGVVAGKEYVGYVWLRAVGGKANVRISLALGDGNEHRHSAATAVEAGEFIRFPFKFTAARSTDQARLLIEVADAPCLIGTASLMPADNVRGFRADTLALLKQLRGTIYRWPGGNFVSGYNWRDGIGPRDRRPPRRNPAWTGVEHNDVGIDEFLDLCHEINAEPMIAVNTGFGDDYSAAQEVEYANGSPDTIGGSWRVKNGHAEPYGVRYWCVGNEMFGAWQLGHMQLGHYTLKHNRAAEAMHKADRDLALVGSGDLNTQDSLGDDKRPDKIAWSQGMLERCGDHMDFISEHFYCGRLPWTKDAKIPIEQHVGLLRNEIRKKAASHRELQPKLGRTPEKFIPIAMDEWNYWHRDYVYGELGCQYNLADALGIAAGLHEYFRNSDIIHMAHCAQTVNVIGCIKTTKTTAFFDTTALPLLLYRREFGSLPLAVTGNRDEHALDVAAAKTADGRAITIGIVNPQAKPQAIQLTVRGGKVGATATVWRITAGDAEATNTPEKHAVAIAEEKDAVVGNMVTVPAYSVSVYRVPLD